MVSSELFIKIRIWVYFIYGIVTQTPQRENRDRKRSIWQRHFES